MTTHPAPAPALSIRRAAPADASVLAEVLSAAFADDPVFAWMFPDPARRPALTRATFDALVVTHLDMGGCYLAAEEPSAAAVWIPVDWESDPATEERIEAAFLAAGQEHAGRMRAILGLMTEVHPHDPHSYLFAIGAASAWQGRGLGSALLRHVLEPCDRDGTAAYLEATTEDSRRLYARHGFVDVGTIQLPDGPPMFRMWRDPR